MPRPVTYKNRLSTNHPNLPAFIDPELNGGLTADDVSSRSNKKFKWTCYAAGHTYTRTPDAATKKRVDGSYSRCPECITLAFHNPDIAAQWHPTKNGDLRPNNVSYGSNKKVWWKCDSPECPEIEVGGYEWEGKISDRTGSKSSGCQACSGKVLTDKNRLSMTHPEIAAQWHPTRNGHLTPATVSHGSNKEVWWKCNSPECPDAEVGGYEWEESIGVRTNPSRKRSKSAGCPACAGKAVTDKNRLSTLYPQIASEWHPTKNDTRTPDDVSYGSNKKAWWLCRECEYAWEVTIADRTVSGKGKGTGCPACAGKVVTDRNRLAYHKEIAVMVLPGLNDGQKAYDIPESSNKRLNLFCPNHHLFGRSPNGMIRKQDDGTWTYLDCPKCNTLAFSYPRLIDEWNYSKNKDKTPWDYRKHSPKKVYWICRKCSYGSDGEWHAQIASRAKGGYGCPACSGLVVTDRNRLTIHCKEVAKEWVRCLDCELPDEGHAVKSNHRAYWRCNLMHEWDAVIYGRSGGNGCPKCHPQRSKREIRIACELAYIFPSISPDDNISLHETDRRKLKCDILEPTNKLVIEYDGVQYHPDKAADVEKTRQLEFRGYKVLRLREAGLELLPDVHNIECNVDYYRSEGIKAIVDDVLRYIDEKFGISNADTKAYLDREGLANAEMAESLIANEYEHQLTLPIQI